MLLRLAYLGVTNAFAMLRLLPMSDREKDDEYRPHQGLANARPLHSLPAPIEDPDRIAHLDIRRRARLDGTLHEYQHAA